MNQNKLLKLRGQIKSKQPLPPGPTEITVPGLQPTKTTSQHPTEAQSQGDLSKHSPKLTQSTPIAPHSKAQASSTQTIQPLVKQAMSSTPPPPPPPLPTRSTVQAVQAKQAPQQPASTMEKKTQKGSGQTRSTQRQSRNTQQQSHSTRKPTQEVGQNDAQPPPHIPTTSSKQSTKQRPSHQRNQPIQPQSAKQTKKDVQPLQRQNKPQQQQQQQQQNQNQDKNQDNQSQNQNQNKKQSQKQNQKQNQKQKKQTSQMQPPTTNTPTLPSIDTHDDTDTLLANLLDDGNDNHFNQILAFNSSLVGDEHSQTSRTDPISLQGINDAKGFTGGVSVGQLAHQNELKRLKEEQQLAQSQDVAEYELQQRLEREKDRKEREEIFRQIMLQRQGYTLIAPSDQNVKQSKEKKKQTHQKQHTKTSTQSIDSIISPSTTTTSTTTSTITTTTTTTTTILPSDNHTQHDVDDDEAFAMGLQYMFDNENSPDFSTDGDGDHDHGLESIEAWIHVRQRIPKKKQQIQELRAFDSFRQQVLDAKKRIREIGYDAYKKELTAQIETKLLQKKVRLLELSQKPMAPPESKKYGEANIESNPFAAFSIDNDDVEDELSGGGDEDDDDTDGSNDHHDEDESWEIVPDGVEENDSNTTI